MVAGVKIAKKAKAVASQPDDSDSDQSELNLEDDDQHMSDDEFPMSEDDADADEEGPSKWALAMAKYLRKSDGGQILSKAVKDVDAIRKQEKPKPTYQFEVVGESSALLKSQSKDEPKENDEKPDDMEKAKELLRQKALLKKIKKKDILGLRVKPSIGDYEREKSLKKIATRGTVQLFNAVRQQQRDVSKKLDEAGKLEYKREKVLKSLNKKEFLNILMNGPRAKSELVDNLVKDETKEEVKSEEESGNDEQEPTSTWGALRADFLTGKKSGWDKDEEQETEQHVDGNLGGSSESD
ncbi:RRP15-like protein isoform X1 [Uranotaenia lowii]|uniref:RRP15-like protein isoform X1 n=1 Tax=Uranotaenia lowii TaxID=190385 RepID=UPI0024790C30|nr:RRP15-like protein isoform X1 [Uranotaenia lowii]